MPRVPLDPARLTGADLNRWYRRTPDEIEAERQATEEARYQNFFGGSQDAARDGAPPAARAVASDQDVLWVANGYGRYKAVRPGRDDLHATQEAEGMGDRSYLPDNAAALEGGQFTDVGNPHNPRLRREWERANGRPWPRTADGRPYDVAHIRAIADGGANTLDNIRPMDPVEHRESHKEDAKRFGKRSSIARAFGGKVEPPAHAPRPARGTTVRAAGLLGLIPNITGILSGRIRTDSQTHFFNDMLGYSSEDDFPREDLIA